MVLSGFFHEFMMLKEKWTLKMKNLLRPAEHCEREETRREPSIKHIWVWNKHLKKSEFSDSLHYWTTLLAKICFLLIIINNK